MSDEGIGARVLRKEDRRFLRGKGRYTDDIVLAGQAHTGFVRSPHAHAKITSVDISKAEAASGVVAVLTGKDWAADEIGGIPCGFAPDGGPQNAPPRPALVNDKANFVGDLVAMAHVSSSMQPRDSFSGPEIVPEASKSPGRILQPVIV